MSKYVTTTLGDIEMAIDSAGDAILDRIAAMERNVMAATIFAAFLVRSENEEMALRIVWSYSYVDEMLERQNKFPIDSKGRKPKGDE